MTLNSKVDEDATSEDLKQPIETLTMKHPLQNSWTLWFFKNDRSKSWEENLREVVTFDTIEDFWALYNHVELASRLGTGSDYSVFKAGVKPMWEDPANAKGGRWLLNLDKKQRGVALDNAWLEVLLCLVGEAFDAHGEVVNGAVVSIRTRGDKIGVWLGNAKAANSVLDVGRCLKSRLGLGATVPLGFEVHEDTMAKSGSTAKSRYTV